MSFQWLNMRITEEQERRERETSILERLPRALDEVHAALKLCVDSYRKAFGDNSAEVQKSTGRLRVTVRDGRTGKLQQVGCVDITATAEIPGFQIEKAGVPEPLIIEVGVLPGDKLFYRDRAKDQYVTMEELTRRTLDRAFFPNLAE